MTRIGSRMRDGDRRNNQEWEHSINWAGDCGLYYFNFGAGDENQGLTYCTKQILPLPPKLGIYFIFLWDSVSIEHRLALKSWSLWLCLLSGVGKFNREEYPPFPRPWLTADRFNLVWAPHRKSQLLWNRFLQWLSYTPTIAFQSLSPHLPNLTFFPLSLLHCSLSLWELY